ncbi:MAG: pantoate--beta-alanine ligase, partial [Bacteroidota bacterium]|nr:pantoate--beta-alanine ligase [Bacteroidota bacterium]
MQILNTIYKIQDFISTQKKIGKTIGFVPTMGALHQGHLSLIEKATQENDIVVSSVFVNPIQFNNKEDLKKYPRNINSDATMLEQHGCDILFAPTTEEMYPEEPDETYEFGALGNVMEGKFRPGHFNGVATVVHKLFDIVKPNNSYFGEKDFQQLAIIQHLVKQKNIDVNVIGCDIIREKDGLAMSSRNTRLLDDERKIAPRIYEILKQSAEKKATNSVQETILFVKNEIKKISEFQLEYFEIVDSTT